jgi:hypothetical protein
VGGWVKKSDAAFTAACCSMQRVSVSIHDRPGPPGRGAGCFRCGWAPGRVGGWDPQAAASSVSLFFSLLG